MNTEEQVTERRCDAYRGVENYVTALGLNQAQRDKLMSQVLRYGWACYDHGHHFGRQSLQGEDH